MIDGNVIKLVHKRFVIKYDKGVPLSTDCPHVAQADRPFTWKHSSSSMQSMTSTKSVTQLQKSESSGSTTDHCPMVLWVDENHNSPQNKSLYSETKAKCSNIIIVKVNSLSHAQKWITTQIDYTKPKKMVQNLIKRKIFRIVVSQHLPDEEEPCTSLQLIQWLKQFLTPEDWNNILVLQIVNPDHHGATLSSQQYIQTQDDPNVYSTSSAAVISEFISYTFLPPGQSNETGSSTNSSLHSSFRIKQSASNVLEVEQDFKYFEIKILGMEKGASVVVGLTNRSFPMYGAVPGSLPDSLGFASEGVLHCGTSDKFFGFYNGQKASFSDGDVIGCGFNTRTKQVYWTKNGKYLGPAEQNRSKFAHMAGLKLFPTVSITKGGALHANFGSEAFIFNPGSLCDDDNSMTKPKLITSDQKISELFPYHDHFLENSLLHHGDSLLVVTTLAKYSRTLNIILRAHLKFQRARPLRYSESKKTYYSIYLKNAELATTLSVTYLFALLYSSEPKSLNIENCSKISDEFFSIVQNPQEIEDINLAGLALGDLAIQSLEERFINLSSIHLWPTVSERGLLALTSFSSLTSINLSDCKNVNDNIINQILRSQKNRFIISLNLSNCVDITDKSIAQLYKSTLATYLQTLILDYCSKISNNALLKVVRACVSLQVFSIASNFNESKILDSTVIDLANLRGPLIKSLNFSRSDKLTADSLIALGKW
jgi:hypothetical protein